MGIDPAAGDVVGSLGCGKGSHEKEIWVVHCGEGTVEFTLARQNRSIDLKAGICIQRWDSYRLGLAWGGGGE